MDKQATKAAEQLELRRLLRIAERMTGQDARTLLAEYPTIEALTQFIEDYGQLRVQQVSAAPLTVPDDDTPSLTLPDRGPLPDWLIRKKAAEQAAQKALTEQTTPENPTNAQTP